MNTPRWLKQVVVFTLPVVVGLFFLTATAHFDYTPDDTYIYLQFVKNFLRGDGIAFNAGEPTYGITSPLWMFMIVVGTKLGLDPYLAAKAADLLFASLALLVFYFLSYEVIRDLAVALCATIAFSVNIWFVRWAGTGMETSLAVLLVLLAVWNCLRNEYLLAVVSAALLALVRPESVLLLGLILADVYINSHDSRRAFRLNGKLLALYAVIVVPWLVYAYFTFGSVVPNTALAKARLQPGIDEFLWVFTDLVRTVAASDGVIIFTLLVSAAVLTAKIITDRLGAVSLEERFYLFRQSFVGSTWILAIPLLYTIAGVNVVSRYLLIVTPFLTILAFWYLYKTVALSRYARFAYAMIFTLTALVLLQSQLLYKQYVEPGIRAFTQGMELSLVPIGKWIKENSPEESVVFVSDVGAVGYFSDRKICDGAGLVSPTLLQLIRDGYTQTRMVEDKIYRTHCRAQFLVDRSVEPERWRDEPDLEPLLIRPFYQMSLSDPRLNYYTLYKVKY